jgi:hypothetical protein
MDLDILLRDLETDPITFEAPFNEVEIDPDDSETELSDAEDAQPVKKPVRKINTGIVRLTRIQFFIDLISMNYDSSIRCSGT